MNLESHKDTRDTAFAHKPKTNLCFVQQINMVCDTYQLNPTISLGIGVRVISSKNFGNVDVGGNAGNRELKLLAGNS